MLNLYTVHLFMHQQWTRKNLPCLVQRDTGRQLDSEDGGLCCGLDLGVGGKDGVGILDSAFLFEEVKSCFRHKKVGCLELPWFA